MLAVTEQPSAAEIAGSLEAFEDVPDRYVWGVLDYRAVDDSEAFVAAKRAAIRKDRTSKSSVPSLSRSRSVGCGKFRQFSR